MKKSFLYSVMALFVCLFAACSQEEIVSDGGQGSNKVSLLVNIPAVGPVSRAANLDVNGYVMRCIMELVDKDGATIAESRQTKAVTGGKASFEFTKPAGEFTCLFWADYVKGTDINATDGVIYNAEKLTEVKYKTNKSNELFNNKAIDAFCGKLASANISKGLNVTLKRPFSRIALSKAELIKLGSDLNQFTASIFGGNNYSVMSSTASAAGNIKNAEIDGEEGAKVATPITIPSEGDVAFYCYVFPFAGTEKASSIKFANNTTPDVLKTVTITAEQMKTMKTNTAVSLVPDGDTPGSDNITVEIEVDNSFEGETTDPEEPTNPETPEVSELAIGQYLYADGTWGTSTTDAIAIVFHVGKYEGDNGTYPMSTVNGYAVALKDASEAVKWLGANTFDSTTTLTTVSQDPKSYDGYKNCQSTEVVKDETAFSALAPVAAALNYNVPLGEDKTSGWYLPTVKQLEDIRTNITAINTAFTALGSEKATAFVADNYWSCIIATSGKVFRAHFDSANDEYNGTGKASGANSAFYVRAILTF